MPLRPLETPAVPETGGGLPGEVPGGAARTPATGNAARNEPLGQRVQSLRLSQIPERRSGWGPWLGLLLLAALAGGGWFGYQEFQRRQAADAAGKPQVATAPAETATPAPRPAAAGDIVLEAKGYIIPAHQILVSPKVTGMIVELYIEEGKRFSKGDVLAVLEKIEYEADLARAKANVDLAARKLEELENGSRPEEIVQAEAAHRESEASLRQLEAQFRREGELRRTGAITPQQFEETESRVLMVRQQVERLRAALQLTREGPRRERIAQAKAELALAQADLAKSEWRLGNCTIRSPISGTILKKNAEEGNIVNAMAFNGSFSVCEMADLADLEVELNIQERDIARIHQGQLCRVRADAYPERVYQGRVARLMPIADRAKGAVPVRVSLQVPADEEGRFLKPEMGAVVSFLQTDDPTAR